MTKRHLFAAAIALACLAHTTISDPVKVRARFAAAPKSDGIAHGTNRLGAVQYLGAKTILLDQPLLLGSKDELHGAGSAQTILVWNGPRGSAAVYLVSYADHGWVDQPVIAGLSIVCPNGADAVALASSVRWVGGATFRDLILSGGGIQMPGEQYGVTLDRVRWREQLGQALRLDGQHNTLRDVDLAGQPAAGFVAPPAMIEAHGLLSIEGSSVIQGAWPCALIESRDWFGSPGLLNIVAGHIEPQANSPVVRLVNSRCISDFAWFAEPQHPWQLINSKAWFTVAPSAGGVKTDAASRVYIGGVEQPVRPTD